MSKRFLKLCSAYLPVFLWASLIYLFSAQSSLPGFDVVAYDYIFKKLSHMTVYGIFYFLVYRAINIDTQGQQKNWIVPFLITFIYAVIDEFHQVFTPMRHPSPLDVGFDMMGASVVFLRLYKFI